jgi:hypothetical protein
MCILMHTVASEMMKECITYFHNNKAKKKNWKQPVSLPGDFLPGDRSTEPWNLNTGAFYFIKVFMGSHTTILNQKAN